ncbi:hypothetical protein OsI_32795 [Oryza sativa Indica Group]|uniref:Uncharacterized protein n=1 Tax=Oryza sativa subsp. indica TaxID=39946 RepID=A2Z573_ORYSI|nr:hypothetical protein OsI_32795 [Oryza sativa Indica Group]
MPAIRWPRTCVWDVEETGNRWIQEVGEPIWRRSSMICGIGVPFRTAAVSSTAGAAGSATWRASRQLHPTSSFAFLEGACSEALLSLCEAVKGIGTGFLEDAATSMTASPCVTAVLPCWSSGTSSATTTRLHLHRM